MQKRWGRYGQFTVETARVDFLKKTRKDSKTGCLLWIGSKLPDGRYGGVGLMGKWWLAHRAAWLLFKGTDPGERCVCHHCDNGLCVNVDHLFIGSHGDNMRDMEKKGRSLHLSGEEHGRAKLNWEEVRQIRRLHKSGKAIRAIARMFPFINRQTVSAVVKFQTWITNKSHSIPRSARP